MVSDRLGIEQEQTLGLKLTSSYLVELLLKGSLSSRVEILVEAEIRLQASTVRKVSNAQDAVLEAEQKGMCSMQASTHVDNVVTGVIALSHGVVTLALVREAACNTQQGPAEKEAALAAILFQRPLSASKQTQPGAFPTCASVRRCTAVHAPVLRGQGHGHGFKGRHGDTPKLRGKDVVELGTSLQKPKREFGQVV